MVLVSALLACASCSLDSGSIEVLASSIGRVACLHFGAGMLVSLPGAIAGCCLRVLLSEGGVCALERACWYHCRALLQGAA